MGVVGVVGVLGHIQGGCFGLPSSLRPSLSPGQEGLSLTFYPGCHVPVVPRT